MSDGRLFGQLAPERWMRLEQHRDKDALLLAPETYDGLILNANLVAGAAPSLASFADKVNKPFLIDPMSHRFARPAWFSRDKDGEVVNKRNYVDLWRQYVRDVPRLSGDPMADSRSLADLDDQGLSMFVANVIGFQESSLRSAWANEVTRFLEIDSLWGPVLSPAAYVAPYAVIGEGDTRIEIRTAVRMATASAALGRPKPVVVILPVTERTLVDFALVRQLAVAMGSSGAAAALVWPVGLTELELADVPGRFTGLRLLVRTLTDAGLETGVLYGGYVSALLKEFGLRAISHSLLYGQSRGLDPSRGRPACVHYCRPLRQLVSFEEVRDVATVVSAREYIEEFCSCEVCRALLGTDRGISAYFNSYIPERARRPMPTPESMALNQVHFLHASSADLITLRRTPSIVAIGELLDAASRYPLRGAAARARRWAERLQAS